MLLARAGYLLSAPRGVSILTQNLPCFYDLRHRKGDSFCTVSELCHMSQRASSIGRYLHANCSQGGCPGQSYHILEVPGGAVGPGRQLRSTGYVLPAELMA